MADDADRAQERIEAAERDALARALAHPACIPSETCRMCGDPIPEARRKAVVTDLCIRCATESEGRK